jgi:hypothetical protein
LKNRDLPRNFIFSLQNNGVSRIFFNEFGVNLVRNSLNDCSAFKYNFGMRFNFNPFIFEHLHKKKSSPVSLSNFCNHQLPNALFLSREYNSAKEICKYPSFSKVGGNYHLDLKIIWSSAGLRWYTAVLIMSSMIPLTKLINYTVTRHRWNCQELEHRIFRSA